MGMGAGAMAHASQEMRRAQRSLDAHLAKRAYMRSAMRDAIHKAAHGQESNFVPKVRRAEHSCFNVCLDCGYFGSEGGTICPACEGGGWVDLSLDESADMVRDIEARRRAAPPKWVKALVSGFLVATVLGVGTATGGMLLFILIGIALSIPAYFLLLRPTTWLLVRPSLRHPARWHVPLHPKRRAVEPALKATGVVQARSGLLTSPFGGVPCVAYELAIRHHDTRSLRAAEWLLRESRSASFQVGAVPVAEDSALLAMPFERIEIETNEETRVRIKHYLRERGLVDNDGELELYETCLIEGREMEVEVHEDPTMAIVAPLGSSGSLRKRRSGPYR